jgi:heme/copper-type cytochrome/quinol oxidase subunit 3
MIYQTIFDEWGKQIKAAIDSADPLAVTAWVLLSIGCVFLFLLIFFTEYKRKERESIKFSFITGIFAAIFFGIGLHLLLISNGNW